MENFDIDYINDYTAEQIADFIKKGETTRDEVVKSPRIIRIIDQIDKLLAAAEIKDWQHALNMNTIEEYNSFKNKYPSSSYCKEADSKIQELESAGDEQEWKIAYGQNTIEAYENYLTKFQNGLHRDDARNKISELEELQKNAGLKEEWDRVDKKSIEELKNWNKNHPNNPFEKEAKKLINQLFLDKKKGIGSLLRDIEEIMDDPTYPNPHSAIFTRIQNDLLTNSITANELLDEIKKNKNLLNQSVVKKLIDQNLISYADLMNIGIDEAFIDKIMSKNTNKVKFIKPKKLESVAHSPSTEIYFWGIPSSGKSCAIGSILSAMRDGKIAKSMEPDTKCVGYNYLNQLPLIFHLDEISVLPERTDTTDTYEMGFDLIDNDDRSHPLTVIDMAGEAFRCLYKKSIYGDDDVLDGAQKEVIKTIDKVLLDNRTKNRKIHFFVIEYGAEKKVIENATQVVYLNGAVDYMAKKGIFGENTDAIYILVTKVDKTNKIGDELKNCLNEYIENEYAEFYNRLVCISKENEFNDGKVERLSFTLGDVCFQDFCRLNDKPAIEIVKKILQRSKGNKTGKGHKILSIFKK